MRTLLVALVIAGCGKGGGNAPQGATAQTGSAVSNAPVVSSLDMHSVTLLETESVIEQRLSDVGAFSTLLKGVTEAVGRYDVAHPGALPAQVDAVVVARASGTRVWLVGPAGDVAAPGLDADIAKLQPVPVKDRHVAAVVHLRRDGTTSNEQLQLPAAWREAVGSQASDVDTIIDRVWPR